MGHWATPPPPGMCTRFGLLAHTRAQAAPSACPYQVVGEGGEERLRRQWWGAQCQPREVSPWSGTFMAGRCT